MQTRGMPLPSPRQPQIVFPLQGKRVWVAGHRGMVGSALSRKLAAMGCDLVSADRATLDLKRQAQVEDWMAANRPQVVVLAAAKVGGIMANNTYPRDFLYENLAIETNIIEAAYQTGVQKLLFLGSSCIYPREAPQPIQEDALLTGPLEPTNQWYAIAKIAGIMLAQSYRAQFGCDYISAMPTNLYGPGDNFDLNTSHVLPAMLRRMHEAADAGLPEVTIWGTGTPRREFLHVDDCADALIFLLQTYSGHQHINVGSGEDIAIQDLARLVADTVGFKGTIRNDLSKPDGTARKLMGNAVLAGMGWAPGISLRDGIAGTYRWFLDADTLRGRAAAE